MTEIRPLRRVTAAVLKTGRVGLLGPDTSRRTSWWELTLECGHMVERPVNQGRIQHVLHLERAGVLKRPVRARCDHCPHRSR